MSVWRGAISFLCDADVAAYGDRIVHFIIIDRYNEENFK